MKYPAGQRLDNAMVDDPGMETGAGKMGSIPKISVILPVYNRETCISAAMDSVMAQSEADWELIVVDDGSADATGAICCRYAEREPRIRVLHTAHRGVSAARNTGLHAAHGQWVVFLDSDDVYRQDAFHTMLMAAEGVDLVAASIRFVKTGEERLLTDVKTTYGRWEESVERNFDRLYPGLFYNSVCAKMYRRAAITAEFDTELSSGEDVYLNLTLLPGMRSIRVLPDVVYEYNYAPERSHGRSMQLTHLTAQRKTLDRWCERLDPTYPKQLAVVFRDYIEFLLVFIVRMSRQKGVPALYSQAILTAQRDVFLADGQRCGFDFLPAGHQAFWRLLQGGNIEMVFRSLDAMMEACFGKVLTVYTL